MNDGAGPRTPALQPRFLTAHWKHLVMINYEVDRSILLPHLPAETVLDTWNGRYYASMVGFLFLKTAVLGMPIPFHRNFEEVNLRFYVRRLGPEGWRRGVVFVREIVPRWAIATVARVAYNENYIAMPMRHRVDLDAAADGGAGSVEYGWRHERRWHHLRATTTGRPMPLVEGSEEEFIAEHYWGYTAQRDGTTMEYRVEHPPWRVWSTSDAALDCDVQRIYGAPFAEAFASKPRSAFVAEGSEIIVRRGERIGCGDDPGYRGGLKSEWHAPKGG